MKADGSKHPQRGESAKTLSKLLVGTAFAVSVFCISGCANIACSSLNTADVLSPGATKLILKQTTQLTVQNLVPDYITDDVKPTEQFPALTTTQFGIGVSDIAEIDIEWPGILPNAYLKLGCKLRLAGDDKFKLAIAPALSAGTKHTENFSWDKTVDNRWSSFTIYGAHATLLASFSPIKNLSGTAAAKLEYYNIECFQTWDTYSNWTGGVAKTWNCTNYSLYLTPRLKLGRFVVMPEVGLYFYEHKGDAYKMIPVLNLALGFDYDSL